MPSSIVSWAGGSIVGGLDIDVTKYLVKDLLEEHKQNIPDWTRAPLQSLFIKDDKKGEEADDANDLRTF